MTTAHALMAFTAAAGLLTITPGLDTALVLRTAAVDGGRRALMAAVGVCLGCIVWGLKRFSSPDRWQTQTLHR